jgi:signal transduction histidine kinase
LEEETVPTMSSRFHVDKRPLLQELARLLQAKRLRVAIGDTGSGIAREYLPHIFDRFYRVEAARSTRGTGLALAIAQSIARTWRYN